MVLVALIVFVTVILVVFLRGGDAVPIWMLTERDRNAVVWLPAALLAFVVLLAAFAAWRG